VLVDGFLAPTGNRTGIPDLFSGKRHDSKALAESGIADRWANHLKPAGPGMLADLGYLGTGANTGWRGRLTDFPEILRTVTGLEIYRIWG